MTFQSIFQQYSWESVRERIYDQTAQDVERALTKKRRTPEDFMALVSPAAALYLEHMAAESKRLTQQRFGKTIQLYVPMYLSNECQNICTYCGFSFTNKMPRTTLTDAQILQEVEAVKRHGYDHLLLVTGEANRTVGVDYLKNALRVVRPHFSNVTIEVQPLEENEYGTLREEGLYGVLVYQETYREETYKDYHPKGKKSNFLYRLDTPERLGRAGIHKIGLGALLGLEDWRVDSFYCALHLDYLKKTYWKTKYSISFPRLRPAEGVQEPNHPVSDRDLVQLIAAWRLLDENLELSLSTREAPNFRDGVLPLGITTMSAGSKTNPGGYAVAPQALEQFEVSDERTPEEVAEAIRRAGYVPVWKDWDTVLS